MSRRSPIPTQLGDAFTVAEALAHGMTRGQLRGTDLATPFSGVRVAAQADGLGLPHAYAARMPDRAFFSHITAAQLWHIPLPLNLNSAAVVHVSVPAGSRAPAGRGVVGHAASVAQHDVVAHGGLRITSLERTALDLASLVDDENLLAILDNILWRKRPTGERASMASLARAIARYQSRRGLARTRELASLATSRADAPPESIFRLRFIRAGFPEVEPNQGVYDAHGRFIAQPDLQIYPYRLAFDYEGDGHRTDKKQWRTDLRRVHLFQDEKWHHTRISGDDLADPRYLLARTRALLIERGWRP